jgi:hypothetical protein
MKDLLIVGDTLDFVTSVPDFVASAGYTLKYRLIPRISGTAITLTASASGDDYRVIVAPATTAGWIAGEYTWSAWVEKAGERHTVDSGLTELKYDPAITGAYDGRTQAQKALEDAKTALANFQATGGRVKRYAIAGREMEFDDAGGILILVNYWQIQVTRENAAKAVSQGQPDPRRIQLRMSNA